MALIRNTPCGPVRPEPQRRRVSAPTASGPMHRLRGALIPLAIAHYCVAIPGLLVVGMDGTGGTVFAALAAIGAGLSLLGIAGRPSTTRPSRW